MHDFRRGSEWRKWDLHAHTPLDNAWENKPNLYSDEDKRKFAKEYITFAKQQGLSAIAITDHNFCNNIEDCLIKYIQQEAVSNDIVVFPGFEITAKDGSGIHILCIFPEDTNLNKIHEIVKRCFKMGTQLQGEFVPVSDKTITELKKEIDDAKLDSVLIFAHAESDNGIFNKKVIQGQRRIEEWHNPAVEMTQLSCPIENLSSKYKCFCDNNDSNYRRKMAYIMASDCRRIQKNGLSDRFALGDKYSWIKADLTFDGLKQAILEPEKRIYNGDIPEKIKHINNEKTKYIDRIHLSTEANNGKWFAQDLLLNYELVSIIGNKGSGKSALADILGLLGNCRKSSDFSFLSKDKFYKDPLANQHKAEIYWRNNDTNAENTICLFSSTQENQIEKVKYIPQNYFERICNSVDNQKDLKQEIENVIFQHLSIDEKQNAINFSNLIEIANKKNNIKREELENKLNLSIKKYVSASNLLLSKNLLLNKSYLEEKAKQRDNIEKQIKELENKKVEKINNNHINNKIQDINIQIQNIRSKIKDEKCSHTKDSSDLKKLEEIIEEIEKFKNNYDSVRNSISSKIDDLNIDIKDIFSFTINFDILETKKLEISSKLASQCKIINEREEECKKLENEKISLENLLTGESKKYNDYINDLNTLKSNLASIMGDKDTIGTYYYYEHLCSQEYIQSIENEKKISFEEMQNISKEIFAKYLDEKEIYSKLKTNVDKYIREFGNEHSSNINIDFNSKITINYQEFRDNIELYICKKGIFYGECRDDFFAKYKDLEFLNKDEFINQCLSLINDIKSNDNNKEDSIKFSLKNEEKEEDFYKYIFSGKYISVNYELRFNNKLISMLSPGERGLLLLIFFLLADKSNVPLILDQPEENLDNETIYSILVPLILQAKKYRQVIMVTHNPNLAVVCDSEQIICAEFNINGNPKIKYTTGSIENKNINEKIVNILEGTMPAFQNREDKYRKNKKY